MRNGQRGFSLVELSIGLFLTTLLGLAAYKITISSTRTFTGVNSRNTYNLTQQQLESVIKDDLRGALRVHAPFDLKDTACDHGQCDGLITTTVTHLYQQDVNRNLSKDANETPLTDKDGNSNASSSVRFVVPDRDANIVLQLQKDMATASDLLQVKIPAEYADRFTKGRFIRISDPDQSDVFMLTDISTAMSPPTDSSLAHDRYMYVGSDRIEVVWNHPLLILSKPYLKGALVQPVNVITLGLNGTDFARKQEGFPLKDPTTLAQNVMKLRPTYHWIAPPCPDLSPVCTEEIVNPDPDLPLPCDGQHPDVDDLCRLNPPQTPKMRSLLPFITRVQLDMATLVRDKKQNDRISITLRSH